MRRMARLTPEESAALSKSLREIDRRFEERVRVEIARTASEILSMDDGKF